jgi:hypothetical protein
VLRIAAKNIAFAGAGFTGYRRRYGKSENAEHKQSHDNHQQRQSRHDGWVSQVVAPAQGPVVEALQDDVRAGQTRKEQQYSNAKGQPHHYRLPSAFLSLVNDSHDNNGQDRPNARHNIQRQSGDKCQHQGNPYRVT